MSMLGGNPVGFVDPSGLQSCPNIPSPKVSIVDSMAKAKERWNPFWFYNQVKPGGEWDYKRINSSYERFGNFNYGVTGKAFGFPEVLLRRLPGYFQEFKTEADISRYNHPLGKYPYGDDPKDQQMIDEGIKYYQCRENNRCNERKVFYS